MRVDYIISFAPQDEQTDGLGETRLGAILGSVEVPYGADSDVIKAIILGTLKVDYTIAPGNTLFEKGMWWCDNCDVMVKDDEPCPVCGAYDDLPF